MQGEFIKGNINDVCAELKMEAERCKGMTVVEWLELRAIDRVFAEVLGISVEEYRREWHGGASN